MQSYRLARDRTRREEIRLPLRYRENQMVEHVYLTTADGYLEATRDKDWVKWNGAMGEEMDSLDKNRTWNLVKPPEKAKVIGCKWIFKRKEGISGVEKPRYKARLVAKGYSQREGIDYNEIFAPVVKHVSIRILLEIVAHEDMELEQLDVKTAFLHGDLEETIYMKQAEGFAVKGKEDWVCLLKKSLYGLKQSPRQWNQKFDQFMKGVHFTRSKLDSCVYVKKLADGSYIYLLLYVDDMLVASKNKREIDSLKKQLNEAFEMKDLGCAKKILGMEISRNRSEFKLELSQKGYVEKILKLFQMDEAKAVKTPLGSHFKLKSATDAELEEQAEFMSSIPYANAVGSIMYTMIGTRPDIAYPVGVVSRFMAKPLKEHWLALKWVLKYLRGTSDSRLVFQRSDELKLRGYSDADFASDLDRRRSITGYVFTLGGTAISWKSGLQKIVALSTTESEYIALTEASKEVIWLGNLLEDFGYSQGQVELFCDSQSAIALSRNSVHHERTKHMAVKMSFLREKVEEKLVKITKISTLTNPADMFTKVLPVHKESEALKMLQLHSE